MNTKEWQQQRKADDDDDDEDVVVDDDDDDDDDDDAGGGDGSTCTGVGISCGGPEGIVQVRMTGGCVTMILVINEYLHYCYHYYLWLWFQYHHHYDSCAYNHISLHCNSSLSGAPSNMQCRAMQGQTLNPKP